MSAPAARAAGSDPVEAVQQRFPDAVRSTHAFRGDATVNLRRESLVDVARFLKEDPGLAMDFLMDLTAVDYSAFGETREMAFFASSGVGVRPTPVIPDEDPWPGPPVSSLPEPERFAVVYHFFSTTHKHRVRLVVPVGGDAAGADAPEVDSLAALWPGANWLEREVWDMFGVRFAGHPDPRRILMYEGFEGHPLRKDYPVDKRQPLIGPVN